MDLEAIVRAGMAAYDNDQVGRDGRSVYDVACDELKAAANSDARASVMPILMSTATGGLGRSAVWWLAFLGMFEEVQFLPRANLELLEFFQEYQPKNSEARAYVLRFLAYVGAPIDWKRPPESFQLKALAAEYPLILADAFVWSQQYERAVETVNDALSKGKVTSAEAKEMTQRWSRIVSPSAGAFIQDVRRPRAPERAARREHRPSTFERAISRWGDRVRNEPRCYPAIA